MHAEHPATG
jgi:hypothetical protein